ncbi:MAG: T9SS type A sorting domain-containing protein [Aureispira sp.]|nr:T9SS type A sorting domain-containing protein [Aureispira sp.]
MIKINQKRELLLLSILMLWTSFSIQAQTPIWGAATSGTASPVGVAEGTLSTPFATANAHPYNINQLSATQWTSYSIHQCDASPASQIQTSNDSAHWKRLQAPFDTTGHGPDIADPLNQTNFSTGWPSSSPGAADGLAVFDSDYLHSSGAYNGNQGNFSSAQTCFDHQGELISPRIDLSAARQSGTNLSLEFYVLHRFFAGATFTVSFSYDDGATWHVTQDILTIANTDAAGYPGTGQTNAPFKGGKKVLVPLAGVWAGYDQFFHNDTQCRIKFTCAARYYYAFVDEVSILSQPDMDLTFAGPDPDGSILDQATALQVSNARYTPSNQVALGQFLFGARIANRGALMAQNVPVYLSVSDIGPTGVSCLFYKDTIVVDTVFGNDLGRLSETDTFKQANIASGFNLSDLNARTTDYICTYEIQDPGNDFDLSNNTITRIFSITENYWSKVRRTIGGDPYANTPVLIQATNPLDNFEWGSIFYVANTDVLDSVKFQYYVSGSYVGGGGQGIKVYVYEWTDVNGDGRLESSSTYNNPELLLKGDGLVSLTGLTAGMNYQGAAVQVNTFPGGGPITLQAGKRYLITLAEGKDHGGVSFSNTTGVLFGGDSGMDYSYNMFADADFDLYSTGGDIDHYPNNTWPGVLYVEEQGGASNGWSNNGFGGDLVPSIGLVMSPKNVSASLCGLAVEEIEDAEKTNAGELTVYPNPTNNNINIEVNFEKEVEKLNYLLTDMVGRVLYSEESNNVLTEVKTFDLNNAPAGVYFIVIRSNNGTMTKRFIKQ